MVLVPTGARPGSVFVGAVAAYTLGRQFLLPLRAKPRHFTWARSLVLALSAIVLVFDIYAGGVMGSLKKGLLPGADSKADVQIV